MSPVQRDCRPGHDPPLPGHRRAAETLGIFHRAVRKTASRDYTPEQITAWTTPQICVQEWALRRASTSTSWVAEIHGVVVGFTDLDATGHIDMMFLDPDHTGQGSAARLLDHVIDTAAAGHLEVLTVDASIRARPLFERHGFAVVREQAPRRHGVSLTNYRMQRPVPPRSGLTRG